MPLTADANVRPLYRFAEGSPGAAWASDGPLLFEPLSPLGVESVFEQPGAPQLFPPPSGADGCQLYNYKYPAWVHRNWVVCTLYCENQGVVLDSRTVAIHIGEGRVVDLVRFVEEFEGVARNTWYGHTGTGLKQRLGRELDVELSHATHV